MLTIENAPDELRFSGKTGERISDAELQAVIDSILAAEAAGDEAPIKEPAAADLPTVPATFAGFAAFAAPVGTFSALASRVETTWQSDERARRIQYFIVHHAATTALSAILSAFAGARQVSANYALGGGTLVGTVPEGRRAWTSASWYDDAAVTIEVANESAGGSWPVRQVDFVILAKLIADVATRHGFPIDDNHVLTHQELYQRFGESYATACPGDLQRRKSELLELARSFQKTGTAPAPAEQADSYALEEDMTIAYKSQEVKGAPVTTILSNAGLFWKASESAVAGLDVIWLADATLANLVSDARASKSRGAAPLLLRYTTDRKTTEVVYCAHGGAVRLAQPAGDEFQNITKVLGIKPLDVTPALANIIISNIRAGKDG